MSSEDRRAPGTPRVPFEALVEVGGALGPSFEAQAIDISEEGMHLRTAYLPEVGQPLTCRFDAGSGSTVMAAGEVVWKQEAGRGGEFAIRFTNLGGEGTAALGRILGLGSQGAPLQAPGSRVRLHIDGLGSPMRARVKESSGAEVTAFSELGFLQVGKQIDLEDAASGAKRPACIDRVKVEIDRESRVPQLVVTLKYDDEQGHEAARSDAHAANAAHSASALDSGNHAAHDTDQGGIPVDEDMGDEPAPAPASFSPSSNEAEDLESIEAGAGKMKGAIARGASKVGPAFAKMFSRAKVTVALLAAKRLGKDESATPARRTTAPAPGGGLHTSGRKVVRGDPATDAAKEIPMAGSQSRTTRRRVAIGGAVAVAAILAVVALRKPAPEAPLASAPPPDTALTTAPTPPAPLSPGIPAVSTPDQLAANATPPSMTSPEPMASDSSSSSGGNDAHGHKKVSKVTPFGNGPVAHGNVLRIKMDGPIERIQGAAQPTGFTVVVPSRRSLEAASPLASRDSRLASIRVANDPNGAELAVAFKDGVPNYQVRARGDTLEIVLAPIGGVVDPKTAAGKHSAPTAKHTDTASKTHGKGHKGHADKHGDKHPEKHPDKHPDKHDDTP